MHEWYIGSLVAPARLALGWLALSWPALACLALLGCAERPASSVSPTEAVAQLRTGQPLLSCREACVAEWRRVQPQAAQLDAAGNWPEVAALVLRVGYQDDLSLYYLGRAAEGLGYPGAATSYYRQSTYISGTSASCQHQSKVCGGVALPGAALSRIAAIERELNRSRPRRTAPVAPRAPGSPAPAADSASSPSEPEPMPAPVSFPPPPAPVPASPPAPAYVPPPIAPAAPSRPAGPAATEFIEPPAAR